MTVHTDYREQIGLTLVPLSEIVIACVDILMFTAD